MILNDQVKQIKEVKNFAKEIKRDYNHQFTNSIERTSNLENFFRELKRKVSFGSWGSFGRNSVADDLIKEKNNKKNSKVGFISTVLMADLPAIRF